MTSDFAYRTGLEMLLLLNAHDGINERRVLSLLDKYFNGNWEAAATFIMDRWGEKNSYFSQLGTRNFEPIITALEQMIEEKTKEEQARADDQHQQTLAAYLAQPTEPFED